MHLTGSDSNSYLKQKQPYTGTSDIPASLYAQNELLLLLSFLSRFNRLGNDLLVLEPLGIVAIIGNSTFISRIKEERTRNDMVCRTAVTAKHDVLHAGKTGQSLNIRIVRLQSHGICKENQFPRPQCASPFAGHRLKDRI